MTAIVWPLCIILYLKNIRMDTISQDITLPYTLWGIRFGLSSLLHDNVNPDVFLKKKKKKKKREQPDG